MKRKTLMAITLATVTAIAPASAAFAEEAARYIQDCDRGDRRGTKRKKDKRHRKGTAAWRREQTHERQTAVRSVKKGQKNGII